MNKLHTEVLPEYSYQLLRELFEDNDLNNFYLVGGTALALQLGHRKSIDLDLFSSDEFSSTLANKYLKVSKVLSLYNNSIELVINNTKVMFMYFAYPLTEPLIIVDTIKLVNPIDIGLMKLLALQGRSTMKDIVDLYFIGKNILPLQTLLDLFEKAYPKESFNAYNSFKTLLDKNDLDKQPNPNILNDINLDECFNYIKEHITKHIKKIVGKIH